MGRLFSEFKIGSMSLRNRTLMAPMTLGYDSEDGAPNENESAYWLARAKGGVGCIITDATSVDPNIPYLGNTLCFRNEEVIEKHKEFVNEIHKTGCKVIPQITHPGPESVCCFYGIAPLASSEYLNSFHHKTRALNKEEIPAIIAQYANASYQAKMAGYDGIELHCAHAYMLLGSFLSPLRNKRTDEYGGSLMNRARLLIEVLDAIKEKCGKEFPIILRCSGSERLEGGNTVEDMRELVPVLIQHGVDAFEISGGVQYEMPNKIIPCHGEPEGVNVPEALSIKEVSSVPVIVVGKINQPEMIRDLIDGEKLDGVVLGRALLADADFVNKMQHGADDEIALCASCALGCVGLQAKRLPASCVINPFAGKETQWSIIPTTEKKKVAVVGGGVAGMAFARIAAIRGFDVTIFEKSSKLGGQMNLAVIPLHKEELSRWVTYLSNELKRLDVNVVYQHKAEVKELSSADFDTIVVATGSTPIALSKGESVYTAHEVLAKEELAIGSNVLIVGGGMVGMEMAETLAARKQDALEMTMIEMAEQIGIGIPDADLWPTKARLAQLKLNILTETKLLTIDGNEAVVEMKGEEKNLGVFDTVIYAVGSKPDNTLYEELKECGKEVYLIGDADKAAQALDAIEAGVRTALNL